MSGMIERVEEAIRKEIGIRPSAPPGVVWDGLMKQAAKAAIEAMREPTPEMDSAGAEAMPAAQGYDMPDDFKNAWQAAIDEALRT